MLSPANERRLQFLKHIFFNPRSRALIVTFGRNQRSEGDQKAQTEATGPSEFATVTMVLHIESQKRQKWSKFETLGPCINSNAKPTPSRIKDFQINHFVQKFTQVVLFFERIVLFEITNVQAVGGLHKMTTLKSAEKHRIIKAYTKI